MKRNTILTEPYRERPAGVRPQENQDYIASELSAESGFAPK